MALLAALVLTGLPFYCETRSLALDGGPRPQDRDASREAEYTALEPRPDHPVTALFPVQNQRSMPFRDLLVSWNVDASAGSGFVVELRVHALDDEGWSEWMHVGEWGDVPQAPREVTCEGGRVDVDYFRGERTFGRCEVRVRAFASKTGTIVKIRRLVLSFSDREREVEPQPALAKRPWGRVLDVPLRSQKTEPKEIAGRICSPTSVGMVMAYRGVDRTTVAVADRAWDPVNEIYGNWPRNVQAAYSLGVPGYLARFSDWTPVEREIEAGNPLIVSIAVKKGELEGAPYEATAGHLLVLCGFDAEGNCVVNDPASPDPAQVRRVYKRSEMEEVWMRRGGTSYVLLRP